MCVSGERVLNLARAREDFVFGEDITRAATDIVKRRKWMKFQFWEKDPFKDEYFSAEHVENCQNCS